MGRYVLAVGWVAVCGMLLGVASSRGLAAKGPAAEPVPERGKAVPFHAEPIRVKQGFAVELVYRVPRQEQGSWVSMAVDDSGRLITSAQDGLLYRVTPGPIGAEHAAKVEPIEVRVRGEDGEEIGELLGSAQGLTYAFGALYVVVNARGDPPNAGVGNGVYRLRDTTGDDLFDDAELLLRLGRGGEHGPHSIRVGPDGHSLYLIAGNGVVPPERLKHSRVPTHWGEDLLLGRLSDPRGIGVGLRAPAGWVVRMDADGRDLELIAAGLRNAYDFAFDHRGELFVYDSDAEGDLGTPWYRPTRLNHVTSGSDMGWRSGSGKWPDYFPDTLPPLLELGEGSPTGMTFGYGAKFPERYQNALYLADWSFGELAVAWIEPAGSTYRAVHHELLVSGTPLPITAVRVNEHDGAIYFVTGGRATQSSVYRIVYVGDEPTDPMAINKGFDDEHAAKLHALRRELEGYHRRVNDPDALKQMLHTTWPGLSHPDRFIRYAARTAIEHQPVERWALRAVSGGGSWDRIEAVVALARAGRGDYQRMMIRALGRLPYESLSREQRLAWLRAYQLVFTRTGRPSQSTRRLAVGMLHPHYPSDSVHENRELSRLAIYLSMPGSVPRTARLMTASPSQQEQLHYAKVLSKSEWGWSPQSREAQLRWFGEMAYARGGKSFRGFVNNLYADVLAQLDEQEREDHAQILAEVDIAIRKAEQGLAGAHEEREFYRNWTVEEVVQAVGPAEQLRGRSYNEGRALFGAAMCFDCHRVNGEGGASGPDLTQIAQRFSFEEIAEKIVEPNRHVSDQYAATIFVLNDGRRITGRITDIQVDRLVVFTDPRAPSDFTLINREWIERMERAEFSMMPPGLLNTLNAQELCDLFAFMLSRGDPDHRVFEPLD